MKNLILPFLTLSVFGCSSDSNEVIEMEIAAVPKACLVGWLNNDTQSMCTQVSFDGGVTFENLSEDIANFDYKWGYHSKLKVEKIELAEPLQDASDFYYNLKSITSETELDIGTEISFSSIILQEHMVIRSGSQYYFNDKLMKCSFEDLCVELEQSTGFDYLVDITFEYQGKGEIELIDYTILTP